MIKGDVEPSDPPGFTRLFMEVSSCQLIARFPICMESDLIHK